LDGLKGQALANEALRVYRRVAAKYPSGISAAELLEELRLAGDTIAAPNHRSALASALNQSQARGVWSNMARGLWLPGSGFDKTASGLYGEELADAIYTYVQRRYPEGVFHYEEAREGLEATGVDVRGTGSTMRGALNRAGPRFEKVAGRRGYWRWKKN
jgi:hypothetical protein